MISLNQAQNQKLSVYKQFLTQDIAPIVDSMVDNNQLDRLLIKKLKTANILGSLVPSQYLGAELDYVLYGLLCKEVGKLSPALRALLTVHDMVCLAIQLSAEDNMKERWLPELSKGETIAAYALSEEGSGSDINQIKTRLETDASDFRLNGVKQWISYADISDLFLVFAKLNDQPVAVLVPSKSPGVKIRRLDNTVSETWSSVNEIKFENVKVNKEDIIGEIGAGFSLVANQTLTLGRYSIAWSNLGILESCFSSCRSFANRRMVDKRPLSCYQLTQKKFTDMIVDIKSVQLLCFDAGKQMNESILSAMPHVMVAKYKSSQSAVWATNECIQLHGASAFNNQNPFKKWLLEAKLSEVIEGSREIHQINIPQLFGDTIA